MFQYSHCRLRGNNKPSQDSRKRNEQEAFSSLGHNCAKGCSQGGKSHIYTCKKKNKTYIGIDNSNDNLCETPPVHAEHENLEKQEDNDDGQHGNRHIPELVRNLCKESSSDCSGAFISSH